MPPKLPPSVVVKFLDGFDALSEPSIGSMHKTAVSTALSLADAVDIGLAIQGWRAEPGANVPNLNPADLEGREWTFYALLNVARRIAPEPMQTPTLGMAHVAVGVMRQVADEVAGLVAAGKL